MKQENVVGFLEKNEKLKELIISLSFLYVFSDDGAEQKLQETEALLLDLVNSLSSQFCLNVRAIVLGDDPSKSDDSDIPF